MVIELVEFVKIVFVFFRTFEIFTKDSLAFVVFFFRDSRELPLFQMFWFQNVLDEPILTKISGKFSGFLPFPLSLVLKFLSF